MSAECRQGCESAITKLQSFIKRLEEERTLFGSQDPDAAARAVFGIALHPRITAVAQKLFEDGHYRDAICAGYLALRNLVQERSLSSLDGTELMNKVFSPNGPVLAVNALATKEDRNEQEGVMYLFKGAVLAIRNPREHSLAEDTADTARECLAFFRHLARVADKARTV